MKGVGSWYIGVCLAQSVWSLVFALEWLFLSWVAMLTILVGLLLIVIQFAVQEALTVDVIPKAQQRIDFWTLQFPFQPTTLAPWTITGTELVQEFLQSYC